MHNIYTFIFFLPLLSVSAKILSVRFHPISMAADPTGTDLLNRSLTLKFPCLTLSVVIGVTILVD